MSRLAGLGCALVVVGAVGCANPPADAICPAVGPGDLVISEVYGNGGTFGQYVELYNASGASLDLLGLHVVVIGPRLPKDDHYPDARMIVGRVVVRRSLTIDVGGRVVLAGLLDSPTVPPQVDYAWQPDFLEVGNAKALPDTNGELLLEACDVTIDRVVWAALPSTGTYSLGLDPPTAAGNDAAAAWCTDPEPDGSPGESNLPCP